MVMAEQAKLTGPDLSAGVDPSSIPEGGKLLGHAKDEAVLLARVGGEFLAIGATCTHYGGPLAEGVMHGDTVRCLWHHACFSLRTGEALRAPALNPVTCWRVARENDVVFVREKIEPQRQPASGAARSSNNPSSVLIVGGGAAGLAAADMLRRE